MRTKKRQTDRFMKKNGIRFAFLAYNDEDVVSHAQLLEERVGTAFMRIDKMTRR